MIYTEFFILFIQIYTEYLLRTCLFKLGDKSFFLLVLFLKSPF